MLKLNIYAAGGVALLTLGFSSLNKIQAHDEPVGQEPRIPAVLQNQWQALQAQYGFLRSRTIESFIIHWRQSLIGKRDSVLAELAANPVDYSRASQILRTMTLSPDILAVPEIFHAFSEIDLVADTLVYICDTLKIIDQWPAIQANLPALLRAAANGVLNLEENPALLQIRQVPSSWLDDDSALSKAPTTEAEKTELKIRYLLASEIFRHYLNVITF